MGMEDAMKDDEASTPVALWYWRHHTPDFDLFGSEDEAARAGFHMEQDGHATVTGVQFPDGRTIARGEWAAWTAAAEQIERAEREEDERRKSQPVRKVRAPFSGGCVIEIDAGEPPWIGEPA